jgi:hypothetical protein
MEEKMDIPIVFINRNRVREGKKIEFIKHYLDNLPQILATKTETLAQLAYENKEVNELTVVRLFPNADALDLQLQGAKDRSKETYKFIEPISNEIFGSPNLATWEKMKEIAGSGVELTINPQYLGGFIWLDYKGS